MTNENMKPFEPFDGLPEEIWLPLFELLKQSQFSIESWTPELAPAIYHELEHPNWAPWLEASEATIAGRATVFPAGQLLLRDQGLLAASVSMNRISWDGDPKTLLPWDQIAGVNNTDYSETYQPGGNTLVMMSMNVAAGSKGKQLPAKLIEYAKLWAKQSGIEHLIGSFRPSGFGAAKKQNFLLMSPSGNSSGQQPISFWEYCQATIPGTEKPLDPWLRSLWWSGMQMIKEDDQAMRVSVTEKEFEQYKKQYHPSNWYEAWRNSSGISTWECGEVGEWKVGTATPNYYDLSSNSTPLKRSFVYSESNVWGEIPLG